MTVSGLKYQVLSTRPPLPGSAGTPPNGRCARGGRNKSPSPSPRDKRGPFYLLPLETGRVRSVSSPLSEANLGEVDRP